MAKEALRRLYQADQEDRARHPIDVDLVAERDEERRSEVRNLLSEGELRDGWDHYWAAVVLIHGNALTDHEEAFVLAHRAVELEPDEIQIRGFFALAKDRLLLSRGQPQWYGTQKVLVNGELVLAPIDSNAVTEEERAAMGVLTLEERRGEIHRINLGSRARAELRRRAEGVNPASS